MEQRDFLANSFLQLVNVIIYEKEEESEGWEQMKRYLEKEYEAY